ncbi:hypothetical protein IVA95_34235 [Bradyrhizobium sp. 157]|uniref:hypothetical protein n=1 Tax=Bradyrhizobium sp. 157 TaxID=2782631 RepID=UPI001FFB129E|nr:hypothetical protein [Bradyrhizobium sp. 157]MCK1642483.1 hypothetical protein [Bradyrhizobium sp. 157]
MSFEPKKLFVGLMKFFSILLPGALLTYLLMGELGSGGAGRSILQTGRREAGAALLFASYLQPFVFRPCTLKHPNSMLVRRSRLLLPLVMKKDARFSRARTHCAWLREIELI